MILLKNNTLSTQKKKYASREDEKTLRPHEREKITIAKSGCWIFAN